MRHKNIADRFFGLVTKHACDRQTDRITTPKTTLAQLHRAVKMKQHSTIRNYHTLFIYISIANTSSNKYILKYNMNKQTEKIIIHTIYKWNYVKQMFNNNTRTNFHFFIFCHFVPNVFNKVCDKVFSAWWHMPNLERHNHITHQQYHIKDCLV